MKLKIILTEIDNKKFKELERENKYTLPKIPVENIFLNKRENLPHEILSKADDYIKDDEYKKLPKQDVKLIDVVPTQKFVNINNLKAVKDIGNKTNAILYKYDNKYYVLDGHHRICINLLDDEYKINAHVFEG